MGEGWRIGQVVSTYRKLPTASWESSLVRNGGFLVRKAALLRKYGLEQSDSWRLAFSRLASLVARLRMQFIGCSTPRKITLIWATMDGFFVLFYVSVSLLRGRTPYLSDLQNGLFIAQDFPDVFTALVWVSFVAHVSIVLTCLLFAWGGRLGWYVAMLQLPFRLVKAPSVSILLVVPLLIPGVSPWLWLGLCLVSEGLKGVSLWWLLRTAKASSLVARS